jgi:tetratricopeptide (TPR) repeat protein
MRAGLYHRQGKNDKAAVWCQECLQTTSQVKGREGQQVMAQVYYLLGAAYYRTGAFKEAIGNCEKSVRLYQEIEDFVGQARALNNMAIVYSDLGDWDKSTLAYHESLEINQRIGNIHEEGFIANNLGNIHLYRGEWDLAISLFDHSHEIWVRIGARLPEAVTLSNLSQVYIYKENWSAARVSLSRSQTIFTTIGSEDFLPELDRRWGEYYLKMGDLEKASDHIQRSIDLATALEARLELGISFKVLGEVELARREYETAEIALLRSLRILDDLQSEYRLAQTRLSLVRLALAAGTDKSPQERLDQAVQTFEKLGAKADLEAARSLAEEVKAAH